MNFDFIQNKNILILLLILVTAITYFPALENGFLYQWDDGKYIVENPFIRDISLKGIINIFTHQYFTNYHPVTTLCYAIEFKLFGLNPVFYHLINVLLHISNSVILFLLIFNIANRKDIAFIISVLFAVHPMQVESVAWISELKDVLYTFFYLFGLLFYLKYIYDQKNKLNYFLVLIFFVLSLLSKPTAITFPLILFIIDYVCERQMSKHLFTEKIPYFLIALLMGLIAVYTHTTDKDIAQYINLHSIMNGCFISCYSFLFYIFQLLIPYKLSAIHYFPVHHTAVLPLIYYCSPVIIFLSFWVFYKFFRHNRMMLSCMLFFIFNIIWFLKIIPYGTAMAAERYTYMASIGIYGIIAGVYYYLFSGIKKIKPHLFSILTIYILILSVFTFNRIKYWKNEITLFSDVIMKYPEHDKAYVIRGNARARENDLAGAIDDYSKAIQLNKLYVKSFLLRGNAYKKQNKLTEAISDYSYAISIDSAYYSAWYNRALVYLSMGDTLQAEINLIKAKELGSVKADVVLKSINKNGK